MVKSKAIVKGTEFKYTYKLRIYYFYISESEKWVCKYDFNDRIFKFRNKEQELYGEELFSIAIFIATLEKRYELKKNV